MKDSRNESRVGADAVGQRKQRDAVLALGDLAAGSVEVPLFIEALRNASWSAGRREAAFRVLVSGEKASDVAADMHLPLISVRQAAGRARLLIDAYRRSGTALGDDPIESVRGAVFAIAGRVGELLRVVEEEAQQSALRNAAHHLKSAADELKMESDSK